jgi:hypothetical protein
LRKYGFGVALDALAAIPFRPRKVTVVVDLNRDFGPDHELTPLTDDVVNELAAAFGVGPPLFTDPVAMAPTCCKYHFLKWIAEQLRAGKHITKPDRERVAKGLETILEEMRLLGKNDCTHANDVVTAAIDAQKTMAQVLDNAAHLTDDNDDEENDEEPIVISLPLGGIDADDIDIQQIVQILAGLLGKGEDALGDVVRGLGWGEPEDVASLAPWIHYRPNGVRIVTGDGTVFLPVPRAVEFAGTIVGWIFAQETRAQETLMRLLAHCAKQARKEQAEREGKQNEQDDTG